MYVVTQVQVSLRSIIGTLYTEADDDHRKHFYTGWTPANASYFYLTDFQFKDDKGIYYQKAYYIGIDTVVC